MSDKLQNLEHDEIALLLPWFVNNSLGPGERARVNRHLADCGACQENVLVLSTVQTTLQHHVATPIVPEPRVGDLMDRLDVQDSQRGGWHWMQGLSLAASIAALTIAGALFLTDRENSMKSQALFETATSSEQVAAMDYVLDVRFEAGTLPADRHRVLQDIQARKISPGNEIGSYQVIVHMPAASLEKIERYTVSVAALPEIQSAQVVAVQMPMKQER